MAAAALAKGSSWPSRRDPVELVLARAMGADWLEQYLTIWRDVALEIDGSDLIAAGVPEGPAVGRGLPRRRAASSKARSRPRQELAAALAASGLSGLAHLLG